MVVDQEGFPACSFSDFSLKDVREEQVVSSRKMEDWVDDEEAVVETLLVQDRRTLLFQKQHHWFGSHEGNCM